MLKFFKSLFARIFAAKSNPQDLDGHLVSYDVETLWAAVIERLPNEISVNASTWEGKPYIHIKPQSKHLGVKDFKYCVEYSSKNSRACVNVESLNGGEEAKRTIQEYIDSKDGPKLIKAMVAQQGAKNKNKWFWSVTTSAEKLNEELVVWYVETITAFYDFFEQEPAGKE